MKKEQREIYRVLLNEIDWPLCYECKAAVLSGCSCMDTDVECKHPFAHKLPGSDGLEPGSDCWAFRPDLSVEFVAGVVGAMLEYGWEVCRWWQDKQGSWRIAGAAYKNGELKQVRPVA